MFKDKILTGMYYARLDKRSRLFLSKKVTGAENGDEYCVRYVDDSKHFFIYPDETVSKISEEMYDYFEELGDKNGTMARDMQRLFYSDVISAGKVDQQNRITAGKLPQSFYDRELIIKGYGDFLVAFIDEEDYNNYSIKYKDSKEMRFWKHL